MLLVLALTELDRLLAESPQTGLQQAAELQLAVRAQFSFEAASPFPMFERCREPRSAELRKNCVAFAERLVSREYQPMLNRRAAVVVARNAGAASERWLARKQEADVLQSWRREHSELTDDDVTALSTGSCEAQQALRRDFHHRNKHDELYAMLADLRERGMTLSAYLASRSSAGR